MNANRVELGTSIPPSPTRQLVMVIGLNGVQFREWSGEQFQIGRARSARTIWNYEHDYPWIVRHEVQLPINRINNKMRECTIYVKFFFFPLLKTSGCTLSELQTVEKQLLKEPNSVQMIDARAAKLSDYSYPITKSSNWTAVIGYPRDRATVTKQIGARRTNHERVFFYRYDYELYRLAWNSFYQYSTGYIFRDHFHFSHDGIIVRN